MDTILYGISVILSGLGFYLSMDRLLEHLKRDNNTVVANITIGPVPSEEDEEDDVVEVKKEEEEEDGPQLIKESFVVEGVTPNGLLVLRRPNE